MSCGVPQSGGMGEHAQGGVVSTDDPAAVQADDALLDNLGAGRVPDGDRVTTELAEWRADVDAEPIPDPPRVPAVSIPRGPVYGVHDVQCEAEYIGPAGSLTDCGCTERAVSSDVALPGNTEDTAGAVEDEQSTAGDLTQMIADRLTGNELLPGRWVILDATPVEDVIVLRVVTWAPSVEPSARTEARYVLRVEPEHPPAP